MKINRLAVFVFCLFVCLLFFVCFFFFFFFFFVCFFVFLFLFFVFFQQISDRQSLFPLEETLKYWVQIIIFLRKEQNSTLALNLRDSSLRNKTFITVSKS